MLFQNKKREKRENMHDTSTKINQTKKQGEKESSSAGIPGHAAGEKGFMERDQAGELAVNRKKIKIKKQRAYLRE